MTPYCNVDHLVIGQLQVGRISSYLIFPQFRTIRLPFVSGNQTGAWRSLINNGCGTVRCDHLNCACLEESWYKAGTEKLGHRYNKTLDSFGDYVEK